MDDVAFTRESLRRELNQGLDLLAKASESESSTDDAMAATRIALVTGKAAKKYVEAVAASFGVEVTDNQSD